MASLIPSVPKAKGILFQQLHFHPLYSHCLRRGHATAVVAHPLLPKTNLITALCNQEYHDSCNTIRGPLSRTTSSIRYVSSADSSKPSSTPQRTRPRIVVAMSGGVDSSVAAHLLQSKARNPSVQVHDNNHVQDVTCNNNSCDGIEVIGLHMSNWNALDEDPDKSNATNTRGKQSSPNPIDTTATHSLPNNSSSKPSSNSTTFCQASEKEYTDAQSVAQHLSIPLHRVSFASEYWIQVFEPFVESLAFKSKGTKTNSNQSELTMPNPDYGCNTFIKFGAMKKYAMGQMNADFVATGHYAQLWHRGYTGDNDSSGVFRDWMMETSRTLEQNVRSSLEGRPEEEWVLNNQHTASQKDNPPPMLLAGADRSKDQSYFLSGVKGEAFRNVIFPLGHLAKSQSANTNADSSYNNTAQQTVRDIAHQAAIPTASKRDSMGICFIGKRNFGQFVSQYLPEPPAPGTFVDVDTGEIVGYHEGSMHYTIGQGAKISGASARYFVCGKGSTGDDGNTVFVCNSTHHPSLYTDELSVDFDAFNWIGLGEKSDTDSFGHVPYPLVEGRPIKLLARTRHLQPLAQCTVSWQRSRDANSLGKLTVQFEKPMRAITPCQVVSLYAGSDGLICLGGGPIKGRGSSYLERGMDVSLSMLHPAGINDLSVLRS
jgi:tRNA U34 2-thiouridine synthase MnmA/TrmU